MSQKDPYQVLGITRDYTDDQVKAAYRSLARKYHPDNYTKDNPLADLATEKMKEINEAYDAIMKERAAAASGKSYTDGGSQYQGNPNSPYYEIRVLINQRRFSLAENRLKAIPEAERTADWHFLMSQVLVHKGYINDAMRELEMACAMDPSNREYQNAKQVFNDRAGGFGSTYYNRGNTYRRQSRDDECCDACCRLWMLDTCCECMGGDCVPCV